MINSISIKESATFPKEPEVFGPLNKVNFVYGANGSGKTTVSRSLDNIKLNPNCNIDWKRERNILVYNEDFVDKNFSESSELPGIFTLGEESKEKREKINDAKEERDRLEDELDNNRQTLKEKEKKQTKVEIELQEACWNIKRKYDDDFREAFVGYMDSKENFADKCKSEVNNEADLLNFDELKAQGEIVFDKEVAKLNPITKVDVQAITRFEEQEILKTRIIGKGDVNISSLIEKLNNSDWVKEGRKYFKESGDICPFCQQKVRNDLEKQLDEYFDETYDEQINRLEALISDYKNKTKSNLKYLKTYLSDDNELNDLLDETDFELRVKELESVFQKNFDKLKEKIEKPSLSISLSTHTKIINDINDIITKVNHKIQEHNKTVENRESEEVVLKHKIWKYVTAELKNDFKRYKSDIQDLNKAVNGLKGTIKEKSTKIKELEDTISELEASIKSTYPTIRSINNILNAYQFDSFKLSEGEQKGSYKLTRDDGENAIETLSEGERTFVSFLYFYHLLNGSTDDENITADKVAVIDDPISSLDSEILFVVSSLIRELISKIRKEEGLIDQIIILTHNVYFHKEISFNTRRDGKGNKLNDETFWTLRKSNGRSRFEAYDQNPVKTSYQLLWQEIQDPDDLNPVTVRNTLRRILENYFKIMGGLADEDLIESFEGKDKMICKSLLSWLHEGSHYVDDDLYVDMGGETVPKYLGVFEEIFDQMGHHSHFNMMMGNSDNNP